MPNINRPKRSGVSATTTKVKPLPDAPTVVLADTGYDNSALVTLTTPTGGAPDTYTITTSPGSFTATGTSPITMTGLTTNVAYTFSATGTNGTGTSATSTGSYTPGMHKSFYSIATQTVSTTGVSTLTFSSIPQTYTHLQIRFIAGINAVAGGNFNFNGDNGNNYSIHWLYGNGSSALSVAGNPASSVYGSIYGQGYNSTSFFGAGVIDVFDYTNTNKYKTTKGIIGIDRNGGGIIHEIGGVWRNTSGITSLTFTAESGTFLTSTQVALYGVA
jgi:hypothetical protein